MGRTFSKILGVGMIGVAALGLAGVVNKPPSSPGGAALILLLIGVGGGTLLWSAFTRRPTKSATGTELSIEQAVLITARALQGRVTAAEVAADRRMPLADAQVELERLERLGACSSLIAES